MHQLDRRRILLVGSIIVFLMVGTYILIPLFTHSIEKFLYLAIFWIFIVGIFSLYYGFKKLREERSSEQHILWYQQTQITQGVALLLLVLQYSLNTLNTVHIFLLNQQMKIIGETILLLFIVGAEALTFVNIARTARKQKRV